MSDIPLSRSGLYLLLKQNKENNKLTTFSSLQIISAMEKIQLADLIEKKLF
jgi:hypothetical protein